eukprot:SAG25_NODE_10216_length_342_cov_0.897119_1_plen_23_part_10
MHMCGLASGGVGTLGMEVYMVID